VKIEHSFEFEMFGNFDLKNGDHLQHLVKSLYALKATNTCEIIELMEASSELCGQQEGYCDAYNFDGVPWFNDKSESTLQELFSSSESVTYYFRNNNDDFEVISDADDDWEWETEPQQEEQYDGISLRDGSGIAIYTADDRASYEAHFPFDEIDAAIEFLLSGDRPIKVGLITSS
jgi:hypothetical protein